MVIHHLSVSFTYHSSGPIYETLAQSTEFDGMSFTLDIESSDDEDREWTEKVREQHKILKAERADKRRKERADKLSAKLSDITKREKAMNQVCSLTYFLTLKVLLLQSGRSQAIRGAS